MDVRGLAQSEVAGPRFKVACARRVARTRCLKGSAAAASELQQQACDELLLLVPYRCLVEAGYTFATVPCSCSAMPSSYEQSANALRKYVREANGNRLPSTSDVPALAHYVPSPSQRNLRFPSFRSVLW